MVRVIIASLLMCEVWITVLLRPQCVTLVTPERTHLQFTRPISSRFPVCVLFAVEITGHSCVISSNLWGQKLGGNSSFVTNCVLTVYSLVIEQMNAGNLQFVPFQGVDSNTPNSFILTRHNQVLVGLRIASVMFKMWPRSHSHPMPVMAAVCHRC